MVPKPAFAADPKASIQRGGRFSFFSVSRPNEMISAKELLEAAAGKRQIPFSLRVGQSGIVGAGQGLFIDGIARVGETVSFFPGVVFTKEQLGIANSMGVVSPSNEFVAACFGGSLFVDAAVSDPTSQSSRLLGSCRARDCVRFRLKPSRNSFAVAQMANHRLVDSGANCSFSDVDFSGFIDSDPSLVAFLPNSPFTNGCIADFKGLSLVTIREIKDEEIFVDYRFRQKLGLPQWFSKH